MTLLDVQEQIVRHCSALGRKASDVRLIAVSKTKPPTEVERVYREGQRVFGENYADELVEKAEQLKDLLHIQWVFIGQLQSNKIKKLVSVAGEIQTVASEKHARYIERYANEMGKSGFPVWIHVNAALESQKYGVLPAEVDGLAQFITRTCPSLDLQGIMAIPPADYTDEAFITPPPLYTDLVALSRRVGRGKISLGMSGDLRLSLTSGSDCVRIGSAIFGARPNL